VTISFSNNILQFHTQNLFSIPFHRACWKFSSKILICG